MKRVILTILSTALLTSLFWAAIPNRQGDIVITPPALKRVEAITICNGTYRQEGNEAKVVTPPSVTVVVHGCDAMKKADGTAITNAFGLPTYLDKPGFKSSIVITDPAKLQQYLALWNSLMDLAEMEAEGVTLGPLREKGVRHVRR